MRRSVQCGRPRRAYALLAVLWVLSFASELGVAMRLEARDALLATENRVGLTRAAWMAEGCAERARSAIEASLQSDSLESTAWLWLDSVVMASPVSVGCDLRLRPTGTQLSVQSDSSRLRALLQALGVSSHDADSLARAIFDRERANPVRSLAEFPLPMLFAEVPGLDSLLSIEDERLLLDRAPLVVVSTLRGLDAEAVRVIAERRAAGLRIGELSALARGLPPASRDTLLAHYAELLSETTPTPEAWRVMSTAAVRGSGLVAAIELRLVRSGSRAALVERKVDW
jgi:hypothetical protein